MCNSLPAFLLFSTLPDPSCAADDVPPAVPAAPTADAPPKEGVPAVAPAKSDEPPPPTTVSFTGEKILYEKDIKLIGAEKGDIYLFVQLPPGAKSGVEVKGVMAYLTWNTDANSIRNLLTGGNQKTGQIDDMTGLQRINAQYSKFAFDHHLALATWTIYWTNDTFSHGKGFTELTPAEQRTFDQKFDHIAEKWREGVNQLAKEKSLPSSQWLLYGMSGGAQWGHRIAMREPDLFAAVHMHINSTYDKPVPAASKVLWLVTTGELEHGFPEAKQFYAEARKLGYEMIFDPFPKIGHDDVPAVDALSTAFFAYALQRIQSKPTRSVAAAEYVGSLSTHEFVPAARVATIPANLRVNLPTKALADAWGLPADQ